MEHAPFATLIRAALAVALLAGFYLIGIGLLAGLAWLSVWLWLAFPGQVAHDVSYLVAATVAGLAVPVWRLWRAAPEPPPEGTPVSEQQAPELWSQVYALAESVGTRPPDEIRLVFEANAWVWEDARLMGLGPGRRYLYLGVPLLQTFTVAQVRAVLAHELGHYSHHHTRLGALTYRGMRVIAHTIASVGPRSFAGVVLSGYAALYFLISLAVMRRMELEADRAALHAAGRQAAVLALRDAPRLGSVWDTFLASYVRWTRSRGYTPADLLSWFGWLIKHCWTELEQAGRRAPDTASRWDSHPPIDERVTMIEGATGQFAVPDPRPALDLVADTHAMAAPLRTEAFDKHIERVAQDEAEYDADRLYQVASNLTGVRRRGLAGVLDLFADGRGIELYQLLAPPARYGDESDLTGGQHGGDGSEPVGRDEEFVDFIFAAVAATVVASGGAHWRHFWSEPMRLVSGDGTIALRPVVKQACHDTVAVAELRRLLLNLGVDEARVTGRTSPRPSLDIGPVFRTLPGTRPSTMTDLLLPDELFLLAHTRSGRRRVSIDAFEAGLAAAALADLRLRARVQLAQTDDATVIVCDTTPTGDRFLDSVLVRVAGGGSRPAYQWLQALGPDVADAVARRLDLLGPYEHNLRGGVPVSDHGRDEVDRAQRVRKGVKLALDSGDLDSRDLVLGRLLWGTELATSVLGWTSLMTRFWLGRLAARDQLAVAIRIVIGLNTRLPSSGTGYGGGGT